MICDAGGIGATQMISEWQRLQSVTKYMNQIEVESQKQKASKKLARRLLTCCYDSMVVILSAGLGEMEDSRAKRLMKFSKKHLNVGNANKRKNTGEAALYALSLEGLHAVSCYQIEQQSKCSFPHYLNPY
jgi:brefeldin A-inhibited guanine nucleotide-exchange protein 3